jgi:chemotaxis protein CheZ
VNSLSLQSAAASEIVDVEYDAIEAALMKTARGRSFLGEFTRRNRNSDTQSVLGAIERLEGAMRANDPVADVQRFRGDVLEMARRIADTRNQLVAMRAEESTDSPIGRAAGELEHIVQATESATSNILGAAEEIQEIAWTLREGGFAVETCEAIDARATNIYLACSFQDITAQRIRKVIDAMAFLEDRITQMIDIWGFSAEEMARDAAPAMPLAGPSDDGMQQDEVDLAMVGAVRAERQPDMFEAPALIDGEFASLSAEMPEAASVNFVEPEPSKAEPVPSEAALTIKPSVEPEPEIAARLSDDIPAEAFEVPEFRDPSVIVPPAPEQDALDKLALRLSSIDGLNVRTRIQEFE